MFSVTVLIYTGNLYQIKRKKNSFILELHMLKQMLRLLLFSSSILLCFIAVLLT